MFLAGVGGPREVFLAGVGEATRGAFRAAKGERAASAPASG